MKSNRVVPLVTLLLACTLAAAAHAQTSSPSTTTPKKPPASTGASAPASKPATSAPKPASAHTTKSASGRLDGIAAVVNDDVVLESDVEEQLAVLLQRAQTQPDPTQVDTLRKQILQALIDEKLVSAEARRQNITVTDAEINQQIDAAIDDAKQRLGGEQAYQEQLKRENTTEDKLRDKYRSDLQKQLPAEKLKQKMFPKKPVTAAEAEAYFKANPDKFPKMPGEVRMSVIQIPVEADSASDLKGKNAALAARKRIIGGEKFAKVAMEVSDDPNTARAGGDLGYFTKGTMEPGLETPAFTLKLNELSAPVRTPYGWHLVEVLDRDTLKTIAHRDSLGPDDKPLLEAHVRHILIRVPVGDDDIARARAVADKVHAELVKGTAFETLVHRYSKYQGPATPDGDLGFVSLGTLQNTIRAGIDTLAIGDFSEVLPNQVGFNIFRVTDRHPARDYKLEEIRDELPDAVAQLKTRDKMEDWLKTLRSKANISIR